MRRISVEFEGLPTLGSEDREWLMKNAGSMISNYQETRSYLGDSGCIDHDKDGKDGKDGKKKKDKECCCPEKVKFFFFWSNVLVINDNAACPSGVAPL